MSAWVAALQPPPASYVYPMLAAGSAIPAPIPHLVAGPGSHLLVCRAGR